LGGQELPRPGEGDVVTPTPSFHRHHLSDDAALTPLGTMFESRDPLCNPEEYVRPPSKDRKDLGVQLVLSLIIGVSALVTFCVRQPPSPDIDHGPS
jgi:hypothetical protein